MSFLSDELNAVKILCLLHHEATGQTRSRDYEKPLVFSEALWVVMEQPVSSSNSPIVPRLPGRAPHLELGMVSIADY